MLALGAANPVFAESLRVGGNGGAIGVMRLLGTAFKQQHANVDLVVVPGLGSSGGRKALLAGALDVAVTSRPGSGGEKIGGAVAYPYGTSPFIIAVPQRSAVAELSLQDVVDIYGGKKTTWPNGERLRLILRPLADSDSEVLKSLSPQMDEALKRAHGREGMKIAVTDEESASAIESTPGGVGSSMLALTIAEKRALKPLVIGGANPTVKSLADGSYPWFKTFYVLARSQPSQSARAFVEFIFSSRGRQMLLASGHWVPTAQERR
jgi:phosphate transport system substrate-binding protein